MIYDQVNRRRHEGSSDSNVIAKKTGTMRNTKTASQKKSDSWHALRVPKNKDGTTKEFWR